MLFVPFVSGAAYNGDMGAMTFGFSAQSDEVRHMTLGLEVMKFVLELNPGVDPTVEGFQPLPAVLDYYSVNMGRDNFDFEGSEDQKNFAASRGQATSNT